MNEIDFRNWISKKSISKKVQSDIISRLKRLERDIYPCDIDEHYHKDKCKYLLTLFSDHSIKFFINKHNIATYKYALNKYIQFCDNFY